jgi:dsDNA-binding SOS-regulon protein
MAVEIKYVVVRKGEEKMTFASKKEADAYDKMLDLAEVFADWLIASPLEVEEQQGEALGLFMAENKEALQQILRSGKLPEENTPADDSEENAEGKLRAVKSA